MGQLVLYLQRHTGGTLRATDYSLSSYCWFLGTVTRWRAAMPTHITDSSFLPLSLSSTVSLLHFSPFHSSTEGKGLPFSSWGHTLSFSTQI